jgi:hypothetical protein
LHQQNFFLFLVVQNSGSFAPARPRKSFADCNFVPASGAKLSEIRTGGVAKLLSGGAKFVSNYKAPSSCPDVQNSSLLLLDI